VSIIIIIIIIFDMQLCTDLSYFILRVFLWMLFSVCFL